MHKIIMIKTMVVVILTSYKFQLHWLYYTYWLWFNLCMSYIFTF